MKEESIVDQDEYYNGMFGCQPKQYKFFTSFGWPASFEEGNRATETLPFMDVLIQISFYCVSNQNTIDMRQHY